MSNGLDQYILPTGIEAIQPNRGPSSPNGTEVSASLQADHSIVNQISYHISYVYGNMGAGNVDANATGGGQHAEPGLYPVLQLGSGRAAIKKVHGVDSSYDLFPLARNRKVDDLRSISGQTTARITFINITSHDASIDWINYEGRRQRYETLSPNKSCGMDTYVTHPWEVVVEGCTTRFLPTAGVEYTAIVGATDHPILVPLRDRENLRSVPGGPDTVVNFINDSTNDARIYWINFQGARQLYKTLKQGESYTQPTYVNHFWEVVAGRNQSLFIAIDFEADVHIK